MARGFLPLNATVTDTKSVNFMITMPGRSGAGNYNDNVVTRRWVMQDIPALKEEPFTTTIDNYRSRIDFQLRAYNFRLLDRKDVMGNWYSFSESLLNDEDFGADLDRNNSWLADSLKQITNGEAGALGKAERIYSWVRDNFKCTSHHALWTSNPIKTIFRNRNGNEADLNLLLAAMLRHEKIQADPVVLSTRDNGFASEIYPLISRFNYVITRITIDSSQYYLDASEPWLAFSKLPECCWNGYARVLNKEYPSFVSLNPDSIREQKRTTVFITNGEKGDLSAHLSKTPGFNEACRVRSEVRSEGEQAYMKKIKTAYSGETTVSNLELDSLDHSDQPLEIGYDLAITPDGNSNLFYFNPMLSEGYRENPFRAAERIYPVEMSSATDEVYTLSMDIPTGYTVDELPGSAKVSLNEDEGYFEYIISKNGDNIQMRSRIKLNKAVFKPEDYRTLRDFFAFIVKKQSEQIVFKKKINS
jgi:hypothetical protein